MPRDKDLKRIIRTRMQKTGEAYTTARAHTLKKPAEPVEPAAAAPEPAPDYAALGGRTDATMKAKTGRTWAEWVQLLDADRATTMTHTQIARRVHDVHGVDGWWAQTVTVGYERIRGLRDIGQRRTTGEFEAGKSRTFGVPLDALYRAFADDDMRARWLPDAHRVRSATHLKGIRLVFEDGTVAVIGFAAKGESKSNAAVSHTKLRDRGAVDAMKQLWSDRFDALGALLL